MSALFKVKAVYDYSSPHDDDLNFGVGQIINITEAEEDDWYTGEYIDADGSKQEGLFPRNFVEKYEPEIPSRPVRPTRPKKDTENPAPVPVDTLAPEPTAPEPFESGPDRGVEEDNDKPEQPEALSPVQSPVERKPVAADKPVSTPQPPPAASQSKPMAAKSPPPAVAEKPAGSSFRDRIAAFNKPAAAPVTPFKPQPGNPGFIKKAFVAPPPSRDAYVPPPREQPPPMAYRREEEPKATEPSAQSATVPQADDGAGEEQAKPISLKDRIALLQKQQQEQAAKQAEAGKKEKPKRPPKKRFESQEQTEQVAAAEGREAPREDVLETQDKGALADDEGKGPQSPNVAASAAVGSPPLPARELTSDTNDADNSDTEDAGLSTGREDNEEKARQLPRQIPLVQPSATMPQAAQHRTEPEDGDKEDEPEEDEENENEEEEDEIDPEEKRRLELRQRMAKMSGGIGMMGMFGGGMPAPSQKKSKPSMDSTRTASGGHAEEQTTSRAPPVPIMALPGLSRTKSPEAFPTEEVEHEEEPDTPNLASSKARGAFEVPDIEDVEDSRKTGALEAGPASPQARPAPPAPSRVARPMSPGELSDDEESLHGSLDEAAPLPPSKETISPTSRQPPPLPPTIPKRSITQDSLDTTRSPISPSGNDKRMSRGPPPLPPTTPSAGGPQTRAPPPPPPGPPSRMNTSDGPAASAGKHEGSNESDEEVTEYEGDYDTDIAPGAEHKDALKAHGRHSDGEEETTADEAISMSPASPPGRIPPPLPPTGAPREVPPPPPTQAPKHARMSSEMPRAAPPPPPPVPSTKEADNDYDPYRYTAPQPPAIPRAVPPPPPAAVPMSAPEDEEDEESDDMYDATPIVSRAPPPPPSERAAPPPPPPANERSAPPPPSSQAPTPSAPSAPPPVRQSMEVPRGQSYPRRSMDQSRPSVEHGFMASDIDLAPNTFWWTQPKTAPPSLQSRKDVLYEVESNTSSKRGGKANTTTDVYVLYMDYSQTTITVNFDPSNPADYSFEQRHDRPPAPLRQDQLEAASLEFGSKISSAAESKQNGTVGNGTPYALVSELISAIPTALKPIGGRSYGALVYANLANASTQQFDEIRAGDVVSFRNVRFQGHRGPMHQKYNIDLTKSAAQGDHVGLVIDWDGTKKKVRVWEQGRESRKVKPESFKLGDLRSGEVRVWRVMGRRWVGWE